ncbi:hypothetical protein BsIDN1_60690 [Bacillus safensis]|uniref:Uncharacterized protein n=1 Tax=Bacillus safensis TaxID=561879 RepID=A0A5S9MHN0_BACIA|nr:hypothetical protein BsIDN1_60690 [Bacillus safensis]
MYASTKDIRDINPHLYGGEMAAQNMVFESLVVNTKKGVQPALAKRGHIKGWKDLHLSSSKRCDFFRW